jgi:hypothetical protein
LLGWFGALANPVIHTLNINVQVLFVLLAHRVEKSHALDVPAVPTIAAVGDHQVIKRTFLRACARKSDTYHCSSVC